MEGLILSGSVGIMRVMNTGAGLSLRVGNAAVPSIKPARTPSSGATAMQIIANGEIHKERVGMNEDMNE